MSVNTNNEMVVPLYRTSDIYFCAYLVALDFPLHGSERVGTGSSARVVFVLRVADSDLNKAKALYFGGTGSVKARKFVDNLKSLKAMVYT